MKNSFVFEAENRLSVGTASARVLRHTNQVPAVIYGGGKPPVLLSLDHNSVIKRLENEAVYSHILKLRINGQEEGVVLKDLQRHPSKPIILHLDFQRVSESQKLRVRVPLHFVGEDKSVGVKKGGVVTHTMTELEVTCLPSNLPEFIEVDLGSVDIGQSVSISDIKTPDGVVVLTHGEKHEVTVASIQLPRVESSEESESEAGDGDSDGESEAEAE